MKSRNKSNQAMAPILRRKLLIRHKGLRQAKSEKMFPRKESHLLLETNGNQTKLLPLNQLFQNYKISHRIGILKTNMTGLENTSQDSWENYHFVASSHPGENTKFTNKWVASLYEYSIASGFLRFVSNYITFRAIQYIRKKVMPSPLQ
jgi:hypothetical protein